MLHNCRAHLPAELSVTYISWLQEDDGMYSDLYTYIHIYVYPVIYPYIDCFTYLYLCLYMAVSRKRGLSQTPPLLQTFVAGFLLQTLVAGLCVEYCSLQQASRREGLSQDPTILLQALSQRGRPGLLQARCFSGAAIYMYIYIYIYTWHTYIYIYMV